MNRLIDIQISIREISSLPSERAQVYNRKISMKKQICEYVDIVKNVLN